LEYCSWVFSALNVIILSWCVSDGNDLSRDMYHIYWSHFMTILCSRVITEKETALLMYLSQHFATAGSNQEIFINNFNSFVV